MSGTPDRVDLDAALDAAVDAAHTRILAGAAEVCCDLGPLAGDLRTVDRLARLGLAAARLHARFRIRTTDRDLAALITLAGLGDALLAEEGGERCPDMSVEPRT